MKALATQVPISLTREEIIQKGIAARKEGVDIFTIGTELQLTMKQVKFAELYCSLSRDYFGNIELCASEAYDVPLDSPQNRKLAKNYGYAALKSEGVKMLCSILIETELPHAAVDRELARVILQEQDLKAKVNAIKVHAEIHDRIRKVQTVEHVHTLHFEDLSEADLKEFIRIAEKAKSTTKPPTKVINVTAS